MICSDTHTHCHSCWCKLFEWIRIEWIRIGSVLVGYVLKIRIGGIRIGSVLVGYVLKIRIGGICIAGIRLRFLLMHTFWMDTHWMDTHSMDTYWWDTCWTDTYCWDTYCKPADANVLNGYALVGYVLVGYVLNGYVWDMCGVMDMCRICVVWDMCGICVVWDTPTIFWRTLRRNVFREKHIWFKIGPPKNHKVHSIEPKSNLARKIVCPKNLPWSSSWSWWHHFQQRLWHLPHPRDIAWLVLPRFWCFPSFSNQVWAGWASLEYSSGTQQRPGSSLVKFPHVCVGNWPRILCQVGLHGQHIYYTCNNTKFPHGKVTNTVILEILETVATPWPRKCTKCAWCSCLLSLSLSTWASCQCLLAGAQTRRRGRWHPQGCCVNQHVELSTKNCSPTWATIFTRNKL